MTTTEIAESSLEDVADFVKTAGIKLYVLPAHENPSRNKQDQNFAFHYSCQLVKDENWFVVYFSKGLALRTWAEPPENFLQTNSPVHVPIGKIGTSYDGPRPPWNDETTQADKDVFIYCSLRTPPYLEEVLDCLATDCRFIDKTQGNFSAWCDLMKTTVDSIQAKTTWDTVIKQRAQLKELLGEGSYHQLVHETEPLK